MAKLKPGPAPIALVAREPNGRISRTKEETAKREAAQLEEAFLARSRVYGLTPEQARLPQAGSALGRMFVRGAISMDQYLAGETIRERYTAAREAMGIREQQTIWPDDDEGVSGGSVEFEESESRVRWVRAMKTQADEVRDAVREVCLEERSKAPERAVDTIIMRDIDMPQDAGNLRLALNAVHRKVLQRG